MQFRSEEGTKRAQPRQPSRANASQRAFLGALRAKLDVSGEEAEQIAASVLSVLEPRVAPNDAQPPTKVRNLLSRCTMHVSEPPCEIDRERLLMMVAEELSVSRERAKQFVRCVFATVSEQASEIEVRQARNQLPPDLRTLWPQP